MASPYSSQSVNTQELTVAESMDYAMKNKLAPLTREQARQRLSARKIAEGVINPTAPSQPTAAPSQPTAAPSQPTAVQPPQSIATAPDPLARNRAFNPALEAYRRVLEADSGY